MDHGVRIFRAQRRSRQARSAAAKTAREHLAAAMANGVWLLTVGGATNRADSMLLLTAASRETGRIRRADSDRALMSLVNGAVKRRTNGSGDRVRPSGSLMMRPQHLQPGRTVSRSSRRRCASRSAGSALLRVWSRPLLHLHRLRKLRRRRRLRTPPVLAPAALRDSLIRAAIVTSGRRVCRR